MTQTTRQLLAYLRQFGKTARPWLTGLAAAVLTAAASGAHMWQMPAPLAPALCAACPEAFVLFCTAGGVVGSLAFLPLAEGTRQAVGCLAALGCRMLFERKPGAMAGSAAALGLIFTQIFWQLELGGSFQDSFQVLGQAVLVVALSALGQILAQPSANLPQQAGFFAVLGWCWAGFALLTSPKGPLDWSFALAGCAVCCFAAVHSPTRALALAIAAGLGISAGQGAMRAEMVALAGGAVGAAAFHDSSRTGCVGAYLAGCLLALPFTGSFSQGLRLLAGCTLAAAVCLLAPPKLLKLLGPATPPGAPGQMVRLGNTLQELAHTVERVCDAMPASQKTLEGVLCEGVCKNCRKNCDCWVEHGNEMLEQVDRLEHETGVLRPDDLATPVAARCIRPANLCAAVNSYREGQLARRSAQARTAALRSAVTEQLFALADALCEQVHSERLGRLPRCRVRCAVAGAAARGISADMARVFTAANGESCLLLADGAGTGAAAAVDGALAADIAQRLLQAGFMPRQAARLVNVALAVTGQEGCATLDILSIDPTTMLCQVYKAGGAPTYFVRSGRVGALQDDTLPLGVSGQVQAGLTRLPLSRGDVAVLVSDGVLSKGDDWLQLFLEDASSLSAQEIAQGILKASTPGCGERKDDRTVLVARLE
ncbi:MAG: serine/threonine-protein phosphatase [Pygmaiobacter massiliensis]|nr:serine/threonine-protein phosphatase [Pygmaiobacter massiliensis]